MASVHDADNDAIFGKDLRVYPLQSTMTTPDYRAWIALLKDDAFAASFQTLGQYRSALITRARTLVAAPEAVGVADEEWDALVERLWDQYETVGYQGERFMYCSDFGTAMDLARQEFSRFAHPAPVPVGERLPGDQ